MGLQHAFAMVGGLIVPPYVVMRFAVGGDADMQQYAIACSLILSGLFTILNCIQFNIPGTKYVFGTGMLSVLGTSFGFLPIYAAVAWTLSVALQVLTPRMHGPEFKSRCAAAN